MKPGLVIGYFVIPALVFFTVGMAKNGIRAPDIGQLQWFLPNYLIFAAPQILWAILTRIFKFSAPVSHAG
jgi:hypothetical protein